MAVDLPNFGILVSLIREHRPKEILAFGHPDILLSDEELAGFGLEGDDGGAHAVLWQLGSELFVVDRRHVAGVDKAEDLNFVLGDEYRSQFDMLIDSGTTEHVFNVGSVFCSVVKALRVGGIVYHCNPLAMFNHGYWNISPVAYHDFYTQNGFEIVRLDVQRKTGFTPLERVHRFRLENDGKVMLVCVARKVAEVGEITFPMQSKYQ